jgi:hypothetical protein
MILVRPVTVIKKENGVYTLENSAGFNNNDYCEFNGQACKIKIENGVYTFTSISDSDLTNLPKDGDVLVGYG